MFSFSIKWGCMVVVKDGVTDERCEQTKHKASIMTKIWNSLVKKTMFKVRNNNTVYRRCRLLSLWGFGWGTRILASHEFAYSSLLHYFEDSGYVPVCSASTSNWCKTLETTPGFLQWDYLNYRSIFSATSLITLIQQAFHRPISTNIKG